uniref:Exosome component 9 n=1 Tax=Salmo trutta TaxID=8032 RepID=A0A674BP09_SALTR
FNPSCVCSTVQYRGERPHSPQHLPHAHLCQFLLLPTRVDPCYIRSTVCLISLSDSDGCHCSSLSASLPFPLLFSSPLFSSLSSPVLLLSTALFPFLSSSPSLHCSLPFPLQFSFSPLLSSLSSPVLLLSTVLFPFLSCSPSLHCSLPFPLLFSFSPLFSSLSSPVLLLSTALFPFLSCSPSLHCSLPFPLQFSFSPLLSSLSSPVLLLSTALFPFLSCSPSLHCSLPFPLLFSFSPLLSMSYLISSLLPLSLCSRTYLLVDPCEREERVMDGLLMIAMNKHREICSIQSSGGIMLLKDQVLRCSKIASVKVSEITELINKALENDKKARKTGGKFGFAESLPQERITALKTDVSPVEMSDVKEKANEIVQRAEVPPQIVPSPVLTAPGTGQVGEGLENSWGLEEEEEEEEEETMELEEGHEEKGRGDMVVILDSDSEEEDVVILNQVTTKEKASSSNQQGAVASKQKQKKKRK